MVARHGQVLQAQAAQGMVTCLNVPYMLHKLLACIFAPAVLTMCLLHWGRTRQYFGGQVCCKTVCLARQGGTLDFYMSHTAHRSSHNGYVESMNLRADFAGSVRSVYIPGNSCAHLGFEM